MTENAKKPSRKLQILEALASMLESSPGQRITTAALAKEVGVSEAALYRHFPSKARMFEGLIEFIEETLFSNINRIMQNEANTLVRCERILSLILMFAERNPGMCRILNGEVLAGEKPRLRERLEQLYDRLETQFKQVLREAEIRDQQTTRIGVQETAQLLLSFADGQINHYVRSNFKKKPTTCFEQQWLVIQQGLLVVA
ncbi:nucleoid occlusion factor SlmA [Litoribrevibacter albus]|uniref:Nucleoid occlusion factor SlmA n=1 Tax=Litoribrevibacter albus TaxID=1473156 RepID=A0AA37W7R6_9GAMM|nr:nucleoid occlusion factor SlmA [Litoribrevibacter albus]GLQ33025.1 nucleoid occlusion factor SlmA [Litoribrevibacter albus]